MLAIEIVPIIIVAGEILTINLCLCIASFLHSRFQDLGFLTYKMPLFLILFPPGCQIYNADLRNSMLLWETSKDRRDFLLIQRQFIVLGIRGRIVDSVEEGTWVLLPGDVLGKWTAFREGNVCICRTGSQGHDCWN